VPKDCRRAHYTDSGRRARAWPLSGMISSYLESLNRSASLEGILDVGICECTCLTGRLGLVRQDGPSAHQAHCKVHPENCGEWRSEAEMEEEKLALAGRIGLK